MNLEQLRKHAKDLLRAHRAGRPEAAARMHAHHPRPGETARLADAQLVVAREYGFPSWPRLRAYARRVEAHGPDLAHAYREDVDYYAERADGLLASAQDRVRPVGQVIPGVLPGSAAGRGRRRAPPCAARRSSAGLRRRRGEGGAAQVIEVDTGVDEHLGGEALALPYQAEQDVLGADGVVAQPERLA